jgi:hypothetical protein
MAIRIHDGNPFTPVFAGPLASLEICLTQKKQSVAGAVALQGFASSPEHIATHAPL